MDPVIIDYDRMFEAAGTVPLPGRPPVRKAYRLIELARWSERRQVPLNPEPQFYRGEVEEPREVDLDDVVPEGLVRAGERWLVLSDDGKLQIDGKDCKKLPRKERRARTVWISE